MNDAMEADEQSTTQTEKDCEEILEKGLKVNTKSNFCSKRRKKRRLPNCGNLMMMTAITKRNSKMSSTNITKNLWRYTPKNSEVMYHSMYIKTLSKLVP